MVRNRGILTLPITRHRRPLHHIDQASTVDVRGRCYVTTARSLRSLGNYNFPSRLNHLSNHVHHFSKQSSIAAGVIFFMMQVWTQTVTMINIINYLSLIDCLSPVMTSVGTFHGTPLQHHTSCRIKILFHLSPENDISRFFRIYVLSSKR
jgi:hypothetical protein